MGKFKYLIVLCITLLGLTSCTEEDATTLTEFDNWQVRNTLYFETCYQAYQDSVAKDSSTYKIFKSVSKSQDIAGASTEYILVKVLKKGTGTECPYATDSVRVHYRGWLMPSENFPDGLQFDTSWYGNYDASTMTPYKCLASGSVAGFNTAVQHMHVGDRWFVTIPYQLGYNATAQNSIPAYSTLRFDITLHSFSRAGYAMPDFQ